MVVHCQHISRLKSVMNLRTGRKYFIHEDIIRLVLITLKLCTWLSGYVKYTCIIRRKDAASCKHALAVGHGISNNSVMRYPGNTMLNACCMGLKIRTLDSCMVCS